MDQTQIDNIEVLGALFSNEDGSPDIVAEPEIGTLGESMGWFGSSFVKKVGKAITKNPIAKAVTVAALPMFAPAVLAPKQTAAVIKSPITKAVVGGVALVFPPVGVPMAAGLVVADRAVRIAEGVKGTPKQQGVMKRTIMNTIKLAKQGDKGAKQAVSMMAAATRIRRTVADQSARAATGTVKRLAGGTTIKRRGKPAVRFAAQVAAKRPEGGVLVKRGGIVERGYFVDAK